MNAVTMDKVSFTYQGMEEPVLKNLDFNFNYGEITLLTGDSGEGKSTVISLISGIIPSVVPGTVKGNITIDGESIEGKTVGEVCKTVGIVLQNAEEQIIQPFVEDEIAFGCENFGFEKEKINSRIEKSCNMMALERDWRTRCLSGGQKQRLITAGTLATEQKILILDEPLANLDQKGAKDLLNLLSVLAKERDYAVLIVEHRLDLVLPYSDKVWTLKNGKLIKIEDKEAFFKATSKLIPDISTVIPKEETVIELNHVAFKVNCRVILKDIDFSIKKKERILLLGENGCGKTTLMRIISGLEKATNGKMIHNLEIKTGSKQWFKKVGVIYQNPNYQLFMPTVRSEIGFGAESEEIREDMIKRFQLESIAERHPQSLSEGQKRRVSIAAVLAARPDILLLDEPTVGQDYGRLKTLVDIVNEIHNETENTMITVTHDLRCAEALCDRAVRIEDGVIKETGGKEMVHRYFFH